MGAFHLSAQTVGTDGIETFFESLGKGVPWELRNEIKALRPWLKKANTIVLGP